MRRTRTLMRRLPATGVLAATALLALALGVACGGEDSAPSSAEKSPARIDIPEVEPEAEQSHAELEQNKLPASYPKDLPTFPGAAPTTSMLVPNGTGMVMFSASSPVDEVAAYYAKALPEHGWTVDKTSNDGKRIQASKDKRSATLSIEAGDDGSQIAVVLSGA